MMEQETHVEQPTEACQQPEAQQPVKPKKHNWFARFMGGDLFQSRFVQRQILLILLICFYCLLLVFNRYRVEDLTKEKQATQDSINYLRETRIQMQKHYQETIKISQIAARLDSTGVGITAGPPYEI